MLAVPHLDEQKLIFKIKKNTAADNRMILNVVNSSASPGT